MNQPNNPGFQQLSQRESDLAWTGMGFDFQRIDAWHKSGQKPHDASSGSLLHIADAMTEPQEVSHLIGFLLHTAVDHLHALKSLLADAKAQHTFAPYTLIRGAIEAASRALWVLQEDDPRQVIHRALTLECINLGDQRRAVRSIDPDAGYDEERLRGLREVLARNDLSFQKVKNAPTVTQIIATAASHFDLPTSHLTWQMCSAAAHGRTWAKQFLTLFEAQNDNGVSKTLSGKLSSNQMAIALSLQTGCNVVEKALTLRSSCSRNLVHSGASFSKSDNKLHIVKRQLFGPRR